MATTKKTNEKKVQKLCKLHKNENFNRNRNKIYIKNGIKVYFIQKMHKNFFAKKQKNKQKTALICAFLLYHNKTFFCIKTTVRAEKSFLKTK